jgi:hypothetical protein
LAHRLPLRQRAIRLHGIYYRVTKGAFAGYWLPVLSGVSLG